MLLEPVETDDDDENVDEAEVGQDWDKVNVQLLVSVEVFDVLAASLLVLPTPRSGQANACDFHHVRIQTGFRRAARTEKVGIYGRHIPSRVQDHDAEQAHEDDVRI